MTPFDYSVRAKPVRSRELINAACAILAEKPGITMKDLARRVGTGPTHLRAELGPVLSGFTRHTARIGTRDRKTSRAWTDKQLIEALREAGDVLGGDVREARYRDLATRPGSKAPSSQTIIRRFGTWNSALEAAQIVPVDPLRGYDKWTAEKCAEAVADFIVDTGSTTRPAYETWAVHRRSYPSGDTIEKVLLWHEAVNAALPLVLSPARAPAFKSLVEAERKRRTQSTRFKTAHPS